VAVLWRTTDALKGNRGLHITCGQRLFSFAPLAPDWTRAWRSRASAASLALERDAAMTLSAFVRRLLVAATWSFAVASAAAAQAPLVDLLRGENAVSATAADAQVAERVRVEVQGPRDTLFVGELAEVALRVWVEEHFARDSLQQISARSLDLPVQVLATWMETHFRAPHVSVASPGSSIALGDRIVTARRLAEREHAGLRYLGFELSANVPVERVGELRLAAPTVRLAYATVFRATLIDEREAQDSRIVAVDGALASWPVVALPEVGRPLDFGGAIGQFEASVHTDRDIAVEGEPLRLTLELRGSGNFGAFAAPRLDRESEFRVVGSLAQPGVDQLRVTYDLVPTSKRVVQTPRVELAYFDPTPPGEYRRAVATPVPLRWRAAASAAVGVVAPGGPVGNEPGPGIPAAGSLFVLVLVALAVVVAVVAAVVTVLVARWRRRRHKSN